jgi:hypothetical protein
MVPGSIVSVVVYNSFSQNQRWSIFFSCLRHNLGLVTFGVDPISVNVCQEVMIVDICMIPFFKNAYSEERCFLLRRGPTPWPFPSPLSTVQWDNLSKQRALYLV